MHTDLPEFVSFDAAAGIIVGVEPVERRLSDLAGCFMDDDAYRAALDANDPVVYSVSSVAPADGDGQLHYGLGRINPGKVGNEYFLTRGHLHERREAAELYVGLEGEGLILLEDERTGKSWLTPLKAGSAAYVPGYAAHRTINTGNVPLVYLGIYPADAGHDYAPIAEKNFRQVVVEVDDAPKVVDRASASGR